MRNMRKLLCGLAVCAVLTGTTAHAEVCRIASIGLGYAVIARPGKLNEMFSLIRAKKNDAAMQCCVACIPRVGTKSLSG